MRLLDQWIHKQNEKLHKVMKQYNQVSHQVRKVEGAFSTVERQIVMEKGLSGVNESKTRKRSRKSSVSKVVIKDGEVMVDRGAI